MFSITKQELAQRFTYRDKSVLDKLYEEGKHSIGAGGHYNNWEFLAVAGKLFVHQECSAIYKPLKNKWFDGVMRASRTQLGLQMWPISQTKEMLEAPRQTSASYFFAMDQSPSNPRRCHWMIFLNQETGVSFGAEKYARQYNLPVVYFRVHKEKRGHYSVDFELVTKEPNKFRQGEIVEKLMRLLEEDIKSKPEYWLWTHKRWKKKKPADVIISPNK
jgi:KDO2-lipid IV(A) lauroyltransferase